MERPNEEDKTTAAGSAQPKKATKCPKPLRPLTICTRSGSGPALDEQEPQYVIPAEENDSQVKVISKRSMEETDLLVNIHNTIVPSSIYFALVPTQ